MRKFLCRLIGHDWPLFKQAKLVGACIQVERIGWHDNKPVLTIRRKVKTFLILCRRCQSQRLEERCVSFSETWAP